MLYLTNDSLDPAWNQAFEEYVFDHVTEDDVLLIWRNAPAVVFSRFLNVFAEVFVSEAVHRGILVRRRPSGGGTVYHDLGNVNYTIIRNGSPYDRDYASFIAPVTETLRSLGIPADLSGESVIAVDGLKVSGSAQRAAHGRVMHHATLLYSSDLDALRTLTRGRRAWFTTKGTASKPAPVTNMRDHMASPFASADDFLHAFTDALTQRLGAHHAPGPGKIRNLGLDLRQEPCLHLQPQRRMGKKLAGTGDGARCARRVRGKKRRHSGRVLLPRVSGSHGTAHRAET